MTNTRRVRFDGGLRSRIIQYVTSKSMRSHYSLLKSDGRTSSHLGPGGARYRSKMLSPFLIGLLAAPSALDIAYMYENLPAMRQ